MTRAERQIRLAAETQGGVPLLTMERLTFRFVAAGFVLLSATLLAGIFFSETLYGAAVRAWKWDHKTVFSILAWVTFAVLLVIRVALGIHLVTRRRTEAGMVYRAGGSLAVLRHLHRSLLLSGTSRLFGSTPPSSPPGASSSRA